LHTWIDTWTHVQLKQWNSEIWQKGPTDTNVDNVRDQIEIF
jgi:hypothetical protein